MDTVCCGDIISLQIENKGFMGMGNISSDSFDSQGIFLTVHDSLASRVPANYANLCTFVIEIGADYSRKGEKLLYGEVVKLRHWQTSKYLSISNIATSDTADKFICQLQEKPSSSCNLQIYPRYKVRTEGESIYYNDKISLMHKSGGGQYIGYAGKDSIVVSFNSQTEGWKVNKYQQFYEDENKYISSGQFIRLFHKEFEGFAIVIPDDMHIRKSQQPLDPLIRSMFDEENYKKKAIGIRMTSGFQDRRDVDSIHTVWQIERDDPKNGDPIERNAPVRIRNVLYGLYLRILYSDQYLEANQCAYNEDGTLKPLGKHIRRQSDKAEEAEVAKPFLNLLTNKQNNEENNYVLSLTPDWNDPQTLFEVLPLYASAEIQQIPVNSLVRLRHQTTQAFIKVKDDLRLLGLGTSSAETNSFNDWFSNFQKDNASAHGEEDKQQGDEDEDDNSSMGYGSRSESDKRSEVSRTSAAGTFSSIVGKSGNIQDKFKTFVLSKEGSDQHVFMAVACNSVSYDYLIYAVNMTNEVKNFLRQLKEGLIAGKDKEVKNKIKDIIKVLSLLKLFLSGQNLPSKYDTQKQGTTGAWKNKALREDKNKKDAGPSADSKQPIKRRQKVLRDLQLFEILFGIIQHYWLLHKMEWQKENVKSSIEKDKEQDKLKAPWTLCKSCHSLVRKMIHGNKSTVASLLHLGTVDLMLDQISTGWNPAISEIFLATSGSVDSSSASKKNIKMVVDQIAQAKLNDGEYPSRILDYISSICAPGGKGNYIIQKWAMEMIIGTKVDGYHTPSSLIFHTKLDYENEGDTEQQFYVLRSHEGLLRPPYKASKRDKDEKGQPEKDIIFDYSEAEKEQMLEEPRNMERVWIRLEDFLPDNRGYYNDLHGFSSTTRVLVDASASFGNRDEIDQRDKQVQYFRSQIGLYTSLCRSSNRYCQKIVSDIMTVDEILHVLKNRDRFCDTDLQLFVELLIQLYIVSAVNGPTPKTLLPNMLIWKGEHQLLNWEDDDSEETSRKIFVMSTQPNLLNGDADWVSTWEAGEDLEGSDEEEQKEEVKETKLFKHSFETTHLPGSPGIDEADITREPKTDELRDSRINVGDADDNVQSTNEIIYNQRLALYNYCTQEICNIFIEINSHNDYLSQTVINPQDSSDINWWRGKLEYWMTLFALIKHLLLRQFFDEEYHADIDAVASFKEDIETISKNEMVQKILERAGASDDKQSILVPFEDENQTDKRSMYYIILNILSLTSPKVHYKQIPDRSFEMYSLIFNQQDFTSVSNKLAEFKTECLGIMQVLYDGRQADKIYRLWDEGFKPLFKSFQQEKRFDYKNQKFKDTMADNRTITLQSFAGNDYREKIEGSRGALKNIDARKDDNPDIRDIMQKFKEFCKKDDNLKSIVNDLFTISNANRYKVGDLLLDLVLYQNNALVVSAMNMIHRHFMVRSELKRIYAEATLLLDDRAYKTVKLLKIHEMRLIDLTQNFTRIPTKPKHIEAFFKTFKAGNPLLDENVRDKPGLVDLCYCGIDLENEDYTVFRRNQVHYERKKVQKRERKKRVKYLKKKMKNSKQGIAKNKKEMKNKNKKIQEELEKLRAGAGTPMEKALAVLTRLNVSPQVGTFDLWTTNQELMRNMGMHINILKLIQRVFSRRSKNKPATDPIEKKCQIKLINVLYEYLFYFIWGNDKNSMDITSSETLDMLFMQIDLDSSVVHLLTEIIVDSDFANNLVQETTIDRIIKRLNPASGGNFRARSKTIEAVDQPLKPVTAEPQQYDLFKNLKQMVNDVSAPENVAHVPHPTRYIELLKSLVESDMGPKPARQKQVTDKIIDMQKANEEQINDYLLRTPEGNYNLRYAMDMYEEFSKSVDNEPKYIAKVKYPQHEEDEFNFHLQFLDLLGMCAKGHNIATTNFCRGIYEDPETICESLADPNVPLCIRSPLTRFLHGAYFSDPKYPFAKEEDDPNMWHTYKYDLFTDMFSNFAGDLQLLISMFDAQAKIEEKDEGRKQWQDDQEEVRMLQRKEQQNEKKQQMKLAKGKRSDYDQQDKVEEDDDAIEELLGNEDLFGDISEATAELSVFIGLDNQTSFIFDVLLPFLTDLLSMDFQTTHPDYGHDDDVEPFTWDQIKQRSDIPPYILISPDRGLINLLRAIIFHVLQISQFPDVSQKENFREGIIDFLNSVLDYLTEHYDDEFSILESDHSSAKSMQINIISTIHKLLSEDIKNEKEQGDMDVNRKLLNEQIKTKMIKDRALPYFIKAVSSLSLKDKSPYKSAALRQELNDPDLLPEFTIFVTYIEKKLDLFISWKNQELSSFGKKRNTSKHRMEKRLALKAYLMEDDEGDQGEDGDDQDMDDEEIDKDDIANRGEDDDDEDAGFTQRIETESAAASVPPQLAYFSKKTAGPAVDRQTSVGQRKYDETAKLNFRSGTIPDKTEIKPTFTLKLGALAKNVNETHTTGKVELGMFGALGTQLTPPDQKSEYKELTGQPNKDVFDESVHTDTNAYSMNWEKREQKVKEDRKDFKKYTGYGAAYIARLIEILTDINVQGTQEGDTFMVRVLQALVADHDFSKHHTLDRKQKALAELGACNMVMVLVSKAKDPRELSDYVKEILPEAVNLGCMILSTGIEEIQLRFIHLYYEAVRKLQPAQYFLISIRELLREARTHLFSLNSERGTAFLQKITDSLLKLIKNICEGHHYETQVFLHRQNTPHQVDLLTELANLLYSVSEQIGKSFVYIDNENFRNKMAKTYITNANKSKKIIAWHKQSCVVPNVYDLLLASQTYRTLSEMIQGPCLENQVALARARACRSVQNTLTYIGAFFFKSVDGRNNTIWHGHGINVFYRYLTSKPKPPSEDIETTQIKQFCHLMTQIAEDPDNDPTGKHILIRHEGFAYNMLYDALDSLEQNILVFLNSMLEGGSSETQLASQKTFSDVTSYLYQSIDEDVMIYTLNNYWKTARLDRRITLLKEMSESEEGKRIGRLRRKVFLYYSMMTMLTEKDEKASSILKPKLTLWQKMYSVEMDAVVGKIEVQTQDQTLEAVYFPKPPLVSIYFNWRQAKSYLIELVDQLKRDNPEEKLMDFQEKSSRIIILMNLLNDINQVKRRSLAGRLYYMLTIYETQIRWLLLITTLMINVFLVVLLDLDDDEEIQMKHSWGAPAMNVLGLMHLWLCILRFLSYVCFWGVFEVKLRLKENKSREVSFDLQKHPFISWIIQVLTLNYCFGSFSLEKKPIEGQVQPKRGLGTSRQLSKRTWRIWYFVANEKSWFYLFFILMSALGLGVDNTFFAFHLVIVFGLINSVQDVFKSVWSNKEQIAATLWLAFIILYWFTITTFHSDELRGAYAFEEHMVCDTLLDCLRTHIDYGLTINPIWNEDEVPVEAIVPNFLYFIIINLTMTAVITAIIMDTFAARRAKREEVADDTNDRCFICNIDRDDFDNAGQDFSKHIKKDHDMWSYLFFRVYLKTLPVTEMTGLETYVNAEFTNNSIKFYPQKKAMILEGRNKEKKDLPTLFMKIDALEKRIKTHEKSQDSMAETAKKIMEKMDELQNLMEPADN